MVIMAIFNPPQSPIVYEQRNTRAVLDKKDLGLGTVYISERTLCWKEDGERGFTIEYAHVSMHAKSADPNVYARECIYVMLDKHISLSGDEVEPPPVNGNDSEDDESDSEADISELVLDPADHSAIDLIYNALSQCQTLNPDPDDAIYEEDNMYEDAEDYEELSGNRLNDLAAGGDTEMNRLADQLQSHSVNNHYSYTNGDQNFDDDQFEDAD